MVLHDVFQGQPGSLQTGAGKFPPQTMIRGLRHVRGQVQRLITHIFRIVVSTIWKICMVFSLF